MALLRDSVAPFLRRRSALCLLLAAIVLLGLTESARGAPWKIRRTVHYKWVYTSESLLSIGPQYFQLPDSIRVYGLVRGGSRVTLEYLLQKEGTLVVEIELEGQGKETRRFPGKESFNENEITLLPELGDKARVAIFTLWLENRPGQRDLSFELKHLGIDDRSDAGAWMDSGTRLATLAPRGSLASPDARRESGIISTIDFQLSSQTGEAARYSFTLLEDFTDLEVRVFNWSERKEEPIREGLTPKCPPIKGAFCPGAWDGLDQEGRESTGTHYVVVVAWSGANIHTRIDSWLGFSKRIEIPPRRR